MDEEKKEEEKEKPKPYTWRNPAPCPCDHCALMRECKTPCVWFESWVKTGV